MDFLVFFLFVVFHLEAKEICKLRGCSCENDSGYDYITCFFDAANDLDNSRDLIAEHEIESIDTFTLKIAPNITKTENIFAGLAINILFMDGSNLKSLNPNIFNSIKSVKNVYLSNNYLSEINFNFFDKNFKNSIESIVLKNNSLDRIPSLSELKSLNYLDLSHNRIQDLSEFEACQSSLDTIDLSENLIENLRYNFSISLKKSLSSLVLNSNKIHELDNFKDFDQLNNLQLSGNKLVSLSRTTFENLPKLAHLDLSHNLISKIDNDTFDSLVELNLLDLSHNQIETIQSEYFKNLKNLQKLFLQSNRIRYFEFSVLNNQNLLYVLDLSANKIEQIEFKDSSNFTNLQLLRLSDNQLESIDYDRIFSLMSNLRMLYLENNYLDQVPKYLGSLIKLDLSNQHDRLIDVPDNAFSRYDTSVLLRLNLSKNYSLKFSNRSFCVSQKRTDSNYFMDLVLSADTLASIDKCVLKQLSKNHRRVRIFTENSLDENKNICDCEYRLFLAHYSILIKDICPRFKTYCKDVKFNDDCDSKPQFECN